MDAQEIQRLIDQKANELKNYAEKEFPKMAGNVALRFIDDNFRKQGYQDNGGVNPWKPNKKGSTILIKTGHLKNANTYKIVGSSAIIQNTQPYAKIHNEGGKAGRGLKTTIPQRQFFPTTKNSEFLQKEIRDKMIQELKKIME